MMLWTLFGDLYIIILYLLNRLLFLQKNTKGFIKLYIIYIHAVSFTVILFNFHSLKLVTSFISLLYPFGNLFEEWD